MSLCYCSVLTTEISTYSEYLDIHSFFIINDKSSMIYIIMNDNLYGIHPQEH